MRLRERKEGEENKINRSNENWLSPEVRENIGMRVSKRKKMSGNRERNIQVW